MPPVRVGGGPGTGKTIVALHQVKHLINDRGADVGGVHGAVDGGVVPVRDRPLPSGRKGGAYRGATAPMPPPVPARNRWAGP